LWVTVLPATFTWVSQPVEQPGFARMPTSRFGSGGGYLSRRDEPRSNVLHIIWSVIKRSAVVVAATIGFMLYYPRQGFKRYALLCGPLAAFIVPWAVSSYLQGRTEVFRAELFVVALIALSPGIALYVFLTWRKAQRLGMAW
jgi:hypothetical protein